MKEKFVEHRFSASALETIKTLNEILVEYQRQNFRLSLRQLYYQMVSRAYIENTPRSYKNLGNLVSDARLAGLIDWDMIEDRGRETDMPPHWRDPAQIIEIAARQFRIDKWRDQDYHIEVMVEKDALSGVLQPVCQELDISITANKGYSSSSTMYEIGQRLKHRADVMDKKITIIYLGDHDPSGIDMTRDVNERLKQFSRVSGIEVVRIALNMNQVEEWNPPENPAKQTDARFASYQDEFGDSSWELDAVEPSTLAELVREAVYERRDEDEWDKAVRREDRMRADLLKFAESYEEPDDLEDEDEEDDE